MNASENIIRDSYKSIPCPSEGLFKDNGSRFLSFAYPVETEEEIKEIVAELKKKYHDARHHCYAYRLGYLGDRFRKDHTAAGLLHLQGGLSSVRSIRGDSVILWSWW